MKPELFKLTYQLELKEWKEIEHNAETMIIEAQKQIVISEILLENAKIKIKKLGGKTNEEIDEEHRNSTTPPII
jgi:hypothetical protein